MNEKASTTAARATDGQQGLVGRSERSFIEQAAKSNHKELAASQLAAERAANPEVKQYAQKIVQDHQEVGRQLSQLAQSKGVEIERMKGGTAGDRHRSMAASRNTPRSDGDTATRPVTTPPTGMTSVDTDDNRRGGVAQSDNREVRQLEQQSGARFDEHYVRLMVQEHEQAVRLFERAANEARDPEVRRFASQHVDSLRQHLEQARALRRSVAE